MSLIRQTQAGPNAIIKQQSNVGEYDAAQKANPSKLSNSASLKTKADELANSSNGKFTSDDAKYVIATKAAQERLKDVDGVTDNKMKEEIDKIYEGELGAEKTGKQIRGENEVTNFFGNALNVIDTINNSVGTGLDGVFDFAVNTLVNPWNKEMGDTLQQAFDGEDLAFIPDIAGDIGLSLIPYAGLPLVIAKNAIQQSNNLTEAFSGKDNVTQEDLDGMQRAGKLLTSLGAIGLSAIPGGGIVKNATKYSDDLAKAVKGVSDNAAKEVAKNKKAYDSAISEAITPKTEIKGELKSPFGLLPEGFSSWKNGDRVQEALKTEAAKNGKLVDETEAALDTLKRLPKEKPPLTVKEYEDEALKQLKGMPYLERLKESNKRAGELLHKDYDKAEKINDAISELKIQKRDAKTKKEKKLIQDKINRAKDARSQYDSHPKLAARQFFEGLIPQSKSTQYAKLNEDYDALLRASKNPTVNSDATNGPLRSLTDWFGRHPVLSQGANYLRNGALLGATAITNEIGETGVDPLSAFYQSVQRVTNDPVAFGTMMVPLGARGLARKTMPNLGGKYQSDFGYQALRAGAVADELSRMSQSDIPESYDEDAIFDILRNAIDRNNNGDQ